MQQVDTVDFHEGRIDSIQALRGISAFLIILEHIRCFSCGAFGVDIFFCISGFIIMFSTHKSTDHFLVRRLIRILPLYYLFTLFTFVILLVLPGLFESSQADIVYLIKSLLFIPFDIGGGVIQPLMRIGWTVNCEIFFYIVFLIALKISFKYRGLISSFILVAIMAITALTKTGFVPLQFYGSTFMFDFVLGIAGYYIARAIHSVNVKKELPKFLSYISIVIAVCLIVIMMATKHDIELAGYRRIILWGIPSLVILLCFYIAGLNLKPVKALTWIGNISFSIYLMHYYPIMIMDRKIFDFSSIGVMSIIGCIIGAAVSIGLAAISYTLIEKKFCGWLKNKLIKR